MAVCGVLCLFSGNFRYLAQSLERHYCSPTEHNETNEPQNEQTKEFISKLKRCPICENIINLNKENEVLFDDEIKEKILYHIQLILPILQNGEHLHYTYHVGQARERKEYNRLEIISFPDDDLDIDNEVKRRKKGKDKLYKEDESLPEKYEGRRKSRRLIDLFKDSPINKEFIVKWRKRIDRKQRRQEKERRRDEDKDKDETKKLEEEGTSLRKKNRKKQQSKEVVKNKDAKKEDDEEEGTPLRMRSRRKHIPGGEGHFADDKEVEDNEYHKNIALSLDQEHKQEEHMGDIRMARSPLRRQLSKERRRHRSQPTGARSLGVLQLPERSLSDQDIGSKPLFYETKHDGAKEGNSDSQGSDNLAMQLALFKSLSKANEQGKDKGSTSKEIPAFQHTEASKGIEEIEEVSSDYSKIQNIQPWDWEKFYYPDSSSGQTSPVRRNYQQLSASCEIFEEDDGGDKEKKEEKFSSPKSPWFNEEDYIEDIEESNKIKKSSKSLKEKMTSKFRKLTENPKLIKIKRAISDKIKRRIKST
uniref:Uncharacterized protein n=1 Tax=Meloidogyne enterolobii TaxID=390850 RepID=A0A6V7VRS1_MELEN|nr:unnamed protein product [Meloidogyne enterolobii]